MVILGVDMKEKMRRDGGYNCNRKRDRYRPTVPTSYREKKRKKEEKVGGAALIGTVGRSSTP